MYRICLRTVRKQIKPIVILIITLVSYLSIRNLIASSDEFIFLLPDFAGSDNLACVHPRLPLSAKRIEAGPLKCGPENWVYTKNGRLYIKPGILQTYHNVRCSYASVQRTGGDFWEDIHTGTFKEFSEGDQLESDFFRVNCKSSDGTRHENLHSGISYQRKLQQRNVNGNINKQTLGLNILIFGFDSMSQVTWRTYLRESYKYFTETLKGVVLEGYNIVGDGTPQALLPILTGHREEELPEARRSHKEAKPMDDHPWIWKNLNKLGYITQYGEDGATYGTFQYRMLGFKNQPTDYYMRPFYLLLENEASNHAPYCVGETPRHLNMLNWIKDLYNMYPTERKFSFLFHSEYSHGENNYMAQWADKDLKTFLEYMERNGFLNNTLLILMADHGPRYHGNRKTVQGKYEERLPYFSIRLPPWFQNSHPEASKNLKTNSHRLTTPFDIHETLKDVINFTGAGVGDIHTRGISLFKEIPRERECVHAGIAPHWCACVDWSFTDTNSSEVVKAAIALVDKINLLTRPNRTLCTELVLDSVQSAAKYAASDNVLKFRGSQDVDGREADMSDSMAANVILYQISISVIPSGGKYEATIRYFSKAKKFQVNEKEISRINKYGNQPHCIMRQKPHLRPYCYCKKSIENL